MLEATIFGTFSLSNGTAVLREEDIRSDKLVQLLVYIIIRREGAVTKKRLSEQFCSGNSKNPENALKNLVYRLRSALRVLGPEEYICTQPGGYQWNPAFPVETDYERFEELAARIRKSTDPEAKKELCRKVVSGYRGDVSAMLTYGAWLQPQIVNYQMIYLNAAKTLGRIYEKEEEWGELEKLCQQVSEHEPLDEDIQCWLVKSLQKQQKYDQALSQYENVKKQFYENLGIRMPEKLKETIQHMATERKTQLNSIAGIAEEAGEKEEPHGAFFCDYQIFRQIYRLEVRRIGRSGISEYMLLLTVRRTGSLWEDAVEDKGLREGAAILEQVIRETLRIGDVAARNGPAQYVVLLSACSYEAGLLVTKRIRKNFLRRIKNRKIELKYELEELSFPWKEGEEREAMGK